MGFGSHYVTSPKMCSSTGDYIGWINKHSGDDDNDEEIIHIWFYLPFCCECEQYIEFANIKGSNPRSHRFLVTSKYCQNDFKTFNDRKGRCSVCCCSIESKIKIYTFEK